jgi:hypothetical protein
MYPSTHMTMYLNNFPTRTVFFKNWKCWSPPRPMLMTTW